MARAVSEQPIGGFLPLALDDLLAASVTPWQIWTEGALSTHVFHNARSALVWLLRHQEPRKLWLPAYICPELATAASGAGIDIGFYSVGENLTPDGVALDRAARRRDAVLGVDYFGFRPGAAFLALVEARRDLVWIEDRAQAFAPGGKPWGDFVLYSPRKLLGVPDGGLLVAYRTALPSVAAAALPDFAFMMPFLERFEDSEERRNRVWYERYREVEAGAAVSLHKMSRTTEALLHRLDAAGIAETRRRNGALLADAFGRQALTAADASKDAVPFGLPLRVVDAAALAARLAERGAFCARHWPALPSDARAFPDEHRLAQSLITLPCDQRYGVAEMRRLIDLVGDALP